MTMIFPDRAPLSTMSARTELALCAGSHFDPGMVRAFLAISLPKLLWSVGPLAFLVNVPNLRWAVEGGVRTAQVATAATVATANAAGVTVVAVAVGALPSGAAGAVPDVPALSSAGGQSTVAASDAHGDWAASAPFGVFSLRGSGSGVLVTSTGGGPFLTASRPGKPDAVGVDRDGDSAAADRRSGHGQGGEALPGDEGAKAERDASGQSGWGPSPGPASSSSSSRSGGGTTDGQVPRDAPDGGAGGAGGRGSSGTDSSDDGSASSGSTSSGEGLSSAGSGPGLSVVGSGQGSLGADSRSFGAFSRTSDGLAGSAV